MSLSHRSLASCSGSRRIGSFEPRILTTRFGPAETTQGGTNRCGVSAILKPLLIQIVPDVSTEREVTIPPIPHSRLLPLTSIDDLLTAADS